jgi:hypothetical protein
MFLKFLKFFSDNNNFNILIRKFYRKFLIHYVIKTKILNLDFNLFGYTSSSFYPINTFEYGFNHHLSLQLDFKIIFISFIMDL